MTASKVASPGGKTATKWSKMDARIHLVPNFKPPPSYFFTPSRAFLTSLAPVTMKSVCHMPVRVQKGRKGGREGRRASVYITSYPRSFDQHYLFRT